MTKPEFKKVMYMRLQTLTNFPYIEDDFDALTDYGLICKVVEHLNKLIENSNLQNETITELYDNFVLLKQYVDQYVVDIDDVKAEIELIKQTLVVLENAINKNAMDIGNVRTELLEIINNNYNTLKQYIDYQDAILDDKITNIQIGEISVYNPTNGLLEPLQDVINSLYGASNKDGLTATEFDALELTATSFDAYNISAYEFDSAGKVILV